MTFFTPKVVVRGKTHRIVFLTLAPLGGGGAKGPLWFFANSS